VELGAPLAEVADTGDGGALGAGTGVLAAEAPPLEGEVAVAAVADVVTLGSSVVPLDGDALQPSTRMVKAENAPGAYQRRAGRLFSRHGASEKHCGIVGSKTSRPTACRMLRLESSSSSAATPSCEGAGILPPERQPSSETGCSRGHGRTTPKRLASAPRRTAPVRGSLTGAQLRSAQVFADGFGA
jgi:hypothetical protein